MDKKIPPHKEAALKHICEKYKGNTLKQQCQRLLVALETFKINTFEASRGLSIYDPPARILQLRKQGISIETVWEYIFDENGVRHRIGCYVLRKHVTQKEAA